MPLYCFDVNRTVSSNNTVDTRSTKKYFSIFYKVLMGIIGLILLLTSIIAIIHAHMIAGIFMLVSTLILLFYAFLWDVIKSH